MTDNELDPNLEWIASVARRPVMVDAAVREQLLAAVRAEPLPERGQPERSEGSAPTWRRRSIHISPLVSTLLAAGLVGIGVALGAMRQSPGVGQQAGQASPVVAEPQRPASDTVVRFVLVAPNANRVSLVGDFNAWSTESHAMTRSANGGVWTITLPLEAGRHLYSFVVQGPDGEQWVADPEAPLAPDNGFGHNNSVVLVGRGAS